MIPLSLRGLAEAKAPYVVRLRTAACGEPGPDDARSVGQDDEGVAFSGSNGLLAIDGASAAMLDGDVVLVDPRRQRVERLLRAGSQHNTLVVTERCDQLCVMCSQPPKKTHVDRFALLEKACLLAAPDLLIGISGGEPTLFKEELLGMVERVISARPDLSFHILSNGQHFTEQDIPRLAAPVYRRVSWGIPIYAATAGLHDAIVAKDGAFVALQNGLAVLIMAGARVELRTVLVKDNLNALPELARFVAARLQFVEAWSLMQLEHVGFAKGRWANLFADHREAFAPLAEAIDYATLHGVRAQLFNFPRCTVPAAYRRLARASISDWKRKFPDRCAPCREQVECGGFFAWHPDDHANQMVQPL
ncbi:MULTISPECIES: His-Xaa-Ser system radical SAM maturase HxsC [unclassified Novosphingobium]|uniref:His-Xaa-Ser system radical SAM maturase HxsC n=1 Tax=unclassified Novosphingobium TaxID=2644732 RepID=UPI00146AAB30|nr:MULTISPECIES: His-Xaa-Ser system radical SAM maturase HxsC [unclassified Novosphingobium]NMN04824.1 His-Xaa-Ser system radical SAM maturase HxsC [Novosphingobium sp. SG919]NMN85182.1 His-Xaa-Ser system radical SAM maturase HxsC [Novosphingobium sp. SG916]